MNSPSTNVAVMYTSETNNVQPAAQKLPVAPANTQPSIASVLSNSSIPKYDPGRAGPSPSSPPYFDLGAMPPPPPTQTLTLATVPTPDPVLVSDADLLLNLHSPFSNSSPAGHHAPMRPTSFARAPSSSLLSHQPATPHASSRAGFSLHVANVPSASEHTFNDMVIDSQEVDMSVFGAEAMPWDLEYLLPEMFSLGEENPALGLLGGGTEI